MYTYANAKNMAKTNAGRVEVDKIREEIHRIVLALALL
jgi:hypothetical protein